jgi:hypothetical protein
MCINGSCCPISRIFENLGTPDCCPVGYIVDATGTSCVDQSPPRCCVNDDPEHFWAYSCQRIPFAQCNDSYPSRGEPGVLWTDSCENTFCSEFLSRGITTGGGVKFCVDITGLDGVTNHYDAMSYQEGMIAAYGITFHLYKRCNRWRLLVDMPEYGPRLHVWLDDGGDCLPNLPPGLTIRKNYSYVRCDDGRPR